MKREQDLKAVFDEYFEGSYAPANSVTDAAKNSIRVKKAPSNALKGAIIAVASFFSVGATAGAAVLTTTTIGGIIDRGDKNNTVTVNYYDPAALTESALDIYAVSTPEGLDFIKTLNLADNCNVESLTAHYGNESVAFVKAELTATVNAYRHDAVIYAEYTQANSACKLFESYYSGTANYYKGYKYLYSQTFDNGEYVSNAYFSHDGVKYYVSVKSSDKNAYYPYFDLILK